MAPSFPHVTAVLGDPRLSDSYKVDGCYGAEDLESVQRLTDALAALEDYRFSMLDDHTTLLAELTESPPAFVLNLCDTGFRNQASQELHIPAYLDLLGIPYSGATPASMVLTLDKSVVRDVAAGLDVPVPDEYYVSPEDPLDALPDRFPALIKPARTDGSLGITQDALVHDRGAARAYIEEVRGQLPGEALLFQEFLPGREYGVGVIGNPPDLTFLPPLAIDFAHLDPSLPQILGYESKAMPDSPYWTDIRIVPAESSLESGLGEKERDRMLQHVRLLFHRFGFRDYGRFDFRTDAEGTIKLMEVNVNPAWSWDGKLAIMAGFAGLEYPELFRRILDAAQTRVLRERRT